MNVQSEIDQLAFKLSNGRSPEELAAAFERQKEKYQKPKATSKEVAYAQYLYSTQKSVLIGGAVDLSQNIAFDAAKLTLKEIMRQRAGEMSELRKKPFQWQFERHVIEIDGESVVIDEAETIRGLIRYFINDDSSPYPINKGLFVYGGVGSGKTEIMSCMGKMCERLDLKKAFVFCKMSDIYTKTRTDKEYDPIEPNVSGSRLFDEFARYTGPVLRFGEPIDINEAIIEQRYDRFVRYGQITHILTNTTPNALQEMISPMLFDRIREMCTSVFFPAKSRR